MYRSAFFAVLLLMEGGDSIGLSMKPLMTAVTCNSVPVIHIMHAVLGVSPRRHVREVGLMEQQNEWIFKKAAFVVVLYPAHEYELL